MYTRWKLIVHHSRINNELLGFHLANLHRDLPPGFLPSGFPWKWDTTSFFLPLWTTIRGIEGTILDLLPVEYYCFTVIARFIRTVSSIALKGKGHVYTGLINTGSVTMTLRGTFISIGTVFQRYGICREVSKGIFALNASRASSRWGAMTYPKGVRATLTATLARFFCWFKILAKFPQRPKKKSGL